MRPTMGVSFRRPLDSHTDCGRDARVPRDDSPNLDCTLEGSVFPDLEILWGPERLQWCVCVVFQKRVDRFGNCDAGVGRGKRAGRGERGSMRYGFVHFCAIFSNFRGKMSALSALPPPPQNIYSNTCLKRGSEISVRLWNFAGFLTRNCSFFAYFCATERKRKLFERAGLPACARRYGWHDGRSIAQMVESGKFGWALGASQNGGEFLATSGELHWDCSAHYSGQPQIWDAPVGVGVRPTMGVSFRRPLDSHTDCGRDARVPRGDSPNLDCTLRARSGASRSGGMAQRGACWLDEATGPRIPHRPP